MPLKKNPKKETQKEFFARLRKAPSLRGFEDRIDDFHERMKELTLINESLDERMTYWQMRKKAMSEFGYPHGVFPENVRPKDIAFEFEDEDFKNDLPKEYFGNHASTKDFMKVCTWIFDHVGLTGVSPKDAPSAGAYAWLREIKKNQTVRNDFYMKFVPRLVAIREKEADTKKARDGNRSVVRTIEEIQSRLHAG